MARFHSPSLMIEAITDTCEYKVMKLWFQIELMSCINCGGGGDRPKNVNYGNNIYSRKIIIKKNKKYYHALIVGIIYISVSQWTDKGNSTGTHYVVPPLSLIVSCDGEQELREWRASSFSAPPLSPVPIFASGPLPSTPSFFPSSFSLFPMTLQLFFYPASCWIL